MPIKKELPVKKVSRTEMVKIIHTTQGKFFTSTHIGKDNEKHVITGNRRKVQDNELGYIKVHSVAVKEPRLINPQTLVELTFNRVNYQLKK